MENLILEQNDLLTEGTLMISEALQRTDRLDEAATLFMHKLSDIERRAGDPAEDRLRLMSETTRAIIEMSIVCEQFERDHAGDQALIKDAQARFRERTDALLRTSYFMHRARTWPQGHPGDYLTIEGFYQNLPRSEGLGYYLDKHFLSTTLATAVRERKWTLAELLERELAARRRPRILDIACGPCRELFELAPAIRAADAEITCVDFDSEALDFAAARLVHAGLADDRLHFRAYNALKMISHQRNLKEFGTQDVIYSVGFFDYLDDDILARLLGALYRLLTPGGTLIASFKDRLRYRTQEYHWFVVWDGFFQRTMEDVWGILDRAEIPRAAVSTVRERSGVIAFFSAKR